MKRLALLPQLIIYTVLRMGWNYCLQFIKPFFEYRTIYTPQYITDQLKAIDDAEAIMSEEERNTAANIARDSLTATVKDFCELWQTLKDYILNAYKGASQHTMLESAGISYYNPAFHVNRTALVKLVNNSVKFINTNETQLMANHNMPATFKVKFLDVAGQVLSLNIEYDNLEQQKGVLAKQKNEVNEAIYATFSEMIRDGKRVFVKDKAVRKNFVINNLVNAVRGHHAASMIGSVNDEQGKAIANVRIYAEDAPFDVTTNNKGRYTIPRIAAGEYRFIVDRAGYEPQGLFITIRPGIRNKFNITLKAAQDRLAVAAA